MSDVSFSTIARTALAAALLLPVWADAETRGGSATGGSARGGNAEGGSAIGGSATGGSAVGGSVTGGSARGGEAMATGGAATSGSAAAGSATAGIATPGTATASVGGRSITAAADGGVSIRADGGKAIVELDDHTLVIDRDTILVDGERRGVLSPSADQVRVTYRGGQLTVRAGEAEILAERLER